MNWPLFITIFSFIFIAELPDKTAFATLLMATKGRPFAVFSGVALAFIVQCFIAVLFGSLISLLPEKWVHIGAGLLYLYFAYHTWFHHDEEEAEAEKNSPSLSMKSEFLTTFLKAFTVIFIAEWGDITQIATATFAAKYYQDKLTVFVAATLALWSVTLIAIFVGQKLKHKISTKVLTKISTILFAVVGAYFLFTAF